MWQPALADQGWEAHVIDLRGHGAPDTGEATDLSTTSMRDYAEDVESLVNGLGRPPALIGWSMGGLVAMIVAASGRVSACVSLEGSPPVQRIDPSVELREGEFGAEEYGIKSRDPREQPTMPDLDTEERTIALESLSRESRLARDERKRGIVIGALPCPLLVVTGESADSKAGRYEAPWLDADSLSVEGSSHWGLVLNRRALQEAIPSVLGWIEKVVTTDPTTYQETADDGA